MIRICVLGSIGSGKSFISKLFNCPIFNADREVNHVYRKDRKCFNQLKNKLSSYIKSFPIKKKELIKAINSNNNNLKIISSIVHPIVRRRLIKFLNKNKFSKIVVLDIPLLVENKLYKKDDVFLFIKSNKSNILDRLKKRKNYNKKIHKTLNQNQAAMLKKRKLAHYIVDNNSPPDIMRKKIKLLKKRIFDERNRT